MWRAALTLSAFAAAQAAASSMAAAPAASPCDASPISVDPTSHAFVDACGRQRIFRGINSVQKLAPYVAETAHWLPGGNSLSPVDGALLQSLGINLVRLGAMWSGVVPHARGGTNGTYLARLVNATAALYGQHGIYTLLDAH